MKSVRVILSVLLVVALMLGSCALAEVPDVSGCTDAEKQELMKSLIGETDVAKVITDMLAELDDNAIVALSEAITVEMQGRKSITAFKTLENGSKGDEVVELQKRLVELGYLSGSADGAFGNKTAEAVKLFQEEVGIKATGIADADTQEALFADNAPKAKIYLSLDYNAISRDPDSYKGKLYTFSGKILQVLESGNYCEMRVATKGGYDNVVYVCYTRKDGQSRFLEDDKIEVKGMSDGLYSYESVLGNTITLPIFDADSITLK